MPQLKIQKLIFGALIFVMFSTSLKAQDSSLIKINYGFSYDKHKYNYTGPDGKLMVKSGFCYTNKIGILFNHYFFKKKRIGLGIELNFGDKRMNVYSHYIKLIDPTPSNPIYVTDNNFLFKYDYLEGGYSFRISYLIKNRLETFIGFQKYFMIQNNKNFQEDSVVGYINHGWGYEYRKTYVLPKRVNPSGFIVGFNLKVVKALNLGFSVSYLKDKILSTAGSNYGIPGYNYDSIFFASYYSFGMLLSYNF